MTTTTAPFEFKAFTAPGGDTGADEFGEEIVDTVDDESGLFLLGCWALDDKVISPGLSLFCDFDELLLSVVAFSVAFFCWRDLSLGSFTSLLVDDDDVGCGWEDLDFGGTYFAFSSDRREDELDGVLLLPAPSADSSLTAFPVCSPVGEGSGESVVSDDDDEEVSEAVASFVVPFLLLSLDGAEVSPP